MIPLREMLQQPLLFNKMDIMLQLIIYQCAIIQWKDSLILSIIVDQEEPMFS